MRSVIAFIVVLYGAAFLFGYLNGRLLLKYGDSNGE